MHLGKKVTSLVLAGALSVQVFAPVHVMHASAPAGPESTIMEIKTQAEVAAKLTLISEQPITAGAVLRKYDWNSIRSKVPYLSKVNVIVVDLQNPHVKLDVMTGVNGKFHSKQSVQGMAKETGAVAGVNGDYFHMQYHKPPFGPSISNGEMLQSPMNLQGWYTFSITGDNKPVIDYYTFNGSVSAANGSVFALAGVNRAAETINGVHSHVNKIHMYTPTWGQQERAVDNKYIASEVLVVNDVIVDMNLTNGLPITVPENGYILRANGAGTEFIKANMKIGDRISAKYDMKALDPQNTADTNSFKMMIGGQTIMVKDGKPSAFTATPIGSNTSRTGVGYSKDGRYVYLITVDKSGSHDGMTLPEFQQLMVKLGVWKGMNLDGGGSTTMVSRPLGEFDVKLTNRPQAGSQRAVVNGLGLYTLAPKGEVQGLVVSGSNLLFLNEKATYGVKAYDTYYNPIESTIAPTLNWSVLNGAGTFAGNIFTPTGIGKTTIQAAGGNASAKMEIEVVGRQQISGLKIDSAPIVFSGPGGTYKVPVVATTKSGLQRTVPATAVNWELIGFEGVVQGDTLTVSTIPASGVGQLVASYDGFSTVLNVSVSSNKLWADFDKLTYPVTPDVYPAEVTGDARIVNELPFREDKDNNAAFITYNFTKGTGNKASYAKMNAAGGGVPIEGEPYKMNVNVLGDNSGNWLRTEVWDANGKLQRININTNINWHGWKTVSVDLTEYNLAYPIKMEHIYVASPAGENQAKRGQIGQIAIDDISFDYRGQEPTLSKNKINLAINRKSLTVNGKTMQIDQAPILQNETTLVPVRFIVDAMGGQVKWDEKTRKVTLQRGMKRIEMWIDDANINVNGKTVTSLLPPKIVRDRTMIPLRVISEQMGWKVSWEDATKSIALE